LVTNGIYFKENLIFTTTILFFIKRIVSKLIVFCCACNDEELEEVLSVRFLHNRCSLWSMREKVCKCRMDESRRGIAE